MKFYGASLSQKLYLVIADGNEYRIGFSWKNSLFYGLKELFSDYSISEGSYIFFNYMTSSDLSVSFYFDLSVNYLDHCSKAKCLNPDDITSSDSSEKSSRKYFQIHEFRIPNSCVMNFEYLTPKYIKVNFFYHNC